jgi:hypothetical protein
VLLAIVFACMGGCKDPAERERDEYLLLKEQLMIMTRTPTADLEPEVERLASLSISSARVQSARDTCEEAYRSLSSAYQNHQTVKKSIASLDDLVAGGDVEDLDTEEAARALEMIEEAEVNLEESMELIEGASERVRECHDALDDLEAAGVGRHR